MARFLIRDFRSAAAAAAEGASRYVQCKAASPDGVLCVYGLDHPIERHSWEPYVRPTTALASATGATRLPGADASGAVGPESASAGLTGSPAPSETKPGPGTLTPRDSGR